MFDFQDTTMPTSRHIIREADLRQVPAESVSHPLDASARRRTKSLGDATGLTTLGIHINVVAPGDTTTVHHAHELVDEFFYILSGEATVVLDNDPYDVRAGDFIGVPARGPAHSMVNTGTVDLVYLVGGERPDFDVCNYPRLGKRLYLVQRPGSRDREFVDVANIRKL
jgi:uncharacterized cupin superfamily protein